jgi:hypothetical protein
MKINEECSEIIPVEERARKVARNKDDKEKEKGLCRRFRGFELNDVITKA